MSFLDTLTTIASETESYVHTGATFLLGAFASADKVIASAEATDPLVKAAADLAVQEAALHGVPVADVETVGAHILAVAQTIAAATAPATPAAASP